MDGIELSPKYGVNPTIPVCFWCGEEKNEVALVGRVGNRNKHEDREMPMYSVVNYEPCDKCREAMEQGVTFMEATRTPNMRTEVAFQKETYPTGKWVVVKREAAHRMFPDLSEEMNKAFIEAGVFDKLFGHITQE